MNDYGGTHDLHIFVIPRQRPICGLLVPMSWRLKTVLVCMSGSVAATQLAARPINQPPPFSQTPPHLVPETMHGPLRPGGLLTLPRCCPVVSLATIEGHWLVREGLGGSWGNGPIEAVLLTVKDCNWLQLCLPWPKDAAQIVVCFNEVSAPQRDLHH